MLTADHKPTWRGYTWFQLQRCAERELKRRKQRFPGYVLTGRLSQQKADWELDMMRVMAEHFAELAEGEKLL